MKVSSRIVRLGLVNSGMFNQLDLNLDVAAIHFVAANNVGKTSLIEAIQFLYFPNLNEMHFSKPLAETLRFYFRPEGSYILFETHTLSGVRRTIGVYGEGTAASRVMFVFDGGFDLADFMDEALRPLPLEAAQRGLFDRRFARYERALDFEYALIGNHSNDAHNVQLFDLSRTNFRLLRRLLHGLLRLERLKSDEIRDFLIAIIETQVRTTINIAADFERKHADIRRIQQQLDEMERLQPIIERWQAIRDDIARLETNVARSGHALWLTWQRFAAYLSAELERRRLAEAAARARRDALEVEYEALVRREAALSAALSADRRQLDTWRALALACAATDEAALQAERERLQRARFALDDRLAQTRAHDLPALERQRRRLEDAMAAAERRLAAQTVSALWETAGFSAEQQALLRFLVGEGIVSLDRRHLDDRATFLERSRAAVALAGVDGVVRVAGLTIPRDVWYRAAEEAEPPAEQLARLRAELAAVDERLAVARDRAQAEAARQALVAEIAAVEARLRQFADLRQLAQTRGTLGAFAEAVDTQAAQLAAVKHALAQRSAERNTANAAVESAAHHRRLMETTLRQIRDRQPPAVDASADAAAAAEQEVDQVTGDQLRELFERLEERVRRYRADLRRRQLEVAPLQQQLQARYDRLGPEQSFREWLALNLDVAQHIVELRELLQQNYSDLFTLVRRELGNLLQAYERVQSQVAALNNVIHRVTVSNIRHVQLTIEPSDLVAAIEQTTERQVGLFDAPPSLSVEEGEQFVADYVSRLRRFGEELRLADLFTLAFDIQFAHSDKPVRQFEIDRFESNGTRIAVKIVLYLGLIRLLQGTRAQLTSRIPFFLDEVGSLDSHNLGQLLTYCDRYNFLPIFASPALRPDIPHSYIFRRDGARSYLANTVMTTPRGAGEAGAGADGTAAATTAGAEPAPPADRTGPA